MVRRALKISIWSMNYYSWYIFWYNMGLVLTRNMIVYLWRTLKVMYPKKACYSYQIKVKCSLFQNLRIAIFEEYKSWKQENIKVLKSLALETLDIWVLLFMTILPLVLYDKTDLLVLMVFVSRPWNWSLQTKDKHKQSWHMAHSTF